MLEQTKNIKQELKQAGIKTSDIRIRNVWSRKTGCKTTISIFNSGDYIKFSVIRKLLKLGYGVSVIKNINHLLIHTDYELKGLRIIVGNDIREVNQ